MNGLRGNALQALKDQGMLVQPVDHVMHEDVMPWLLEKMMGFLDDDEFLDLNTDEVVNDAYDLCKYRHNQSVVAEY